MKLGSWPDYLAMRTGVLRLNAEYRDVLSNDLGAIAGLLFDVGSDRYKAPPTTNSPEAVESWARDVAAVQALAERERPVSRDDNSDRTHTEVQGWLRNIGFGLGYDVWIASNDRSRSFEDGRLGEGCLEVLPMLDGTRGLDAVRLIDVLWLEKGGARIVSAFEVEHTTSIYSGIVRMLDLALSPCGGLLKGIFLVAPDSREEDVRAQVTRPAFASVANLDVRFLPYGELSKHRASIIRFGEG